MQKSKKHIFTEEQEWFKKLFEKSPFPKFVIDKKTFRFLAVNTATIDLYGYTKEELLNLTLKDIQTISKQSLIADQLKDVNEGYDVEFTITQNKKRKEKITSIIQATEVLYENKKAILVLIRDNSQLKTAQKSLNRKNKELQKTNEELDRFVYSISHDLRSPLTSIMGLIQIAESESDKKHIALYLEKMKNSVVKLDNYIKDIVDFSRNNRVKPVYEKINFEEIIYNTLENLDYLDGINKLKITIEKEEETTFYSDKTRVLVILNNLITNAIKYHNYSQSDPYINFRIKLTPKFGSIIIEDNGNGIDKKDLRKIFEMFFRASSKNSGSGLGLYIVKQSIEKLKGIIKVSSEKNNGTSFIVTLPNKL